MTQSNIDLPRELIQAFCQRNHVRRLALFGSVLRDDFGPESDVDMLIEFEPGHMPGLAFIRMQVVVDMPPLVVVLERVVPPDEA
jgi:hypothetical protein